MVILKKFNEINEPDFKVLRYLVRTGETVVDIGANIGWYTKFLSDLVGENGRVISAEPISETFALLSFCVKQLGLSNIKLLNFAISDREGISRMEIPKYNFGGLNFYRAKIINSEKRQCSTKTFPVILKTLDSLLLNYEDNISFIKCDVEGHELEVIKGARKVISKFKPVWLIEVCSEPNENNSSASVLFEIMYKHGYNAYWYDGKGLHEYLNGCKSTNYFFFTNTQFEQILKMDYSVK